MVSVNSTLMMGESRSLGGGFGLALLGVFLGMVLAGPAVTAAQRALLTRADPSPYKGYSGMRLFKQAPRTVYYHDQTIAVLELSPQRELLNCELIEVYNNAQKKQALRNLTAISKPQGISFGNMMDLMSKCHVVPVPSMSRKESISVDARGSSTSLFSGVLPGTKWCGVGDLAEDYFDLGQELNIDKCCRTHDLCPVKVRGSMSRYNLTNVSVYTKSHCRCDSDFQRCLKSQSHPTADLMGNIYFNILRVPCIEDKGTKKYFHKSQNYS